MSLSRLASRQAAQTAALRAPGLAAPPRPQDNFDLLTKYIPTETITLFVAAMSIHAALESVWPALTPWRLYAAFAILTPSLLVLISWLKQRQAERSAGVPPAPFKPALWPAFASLVAFLVWALSVPPLLHNDAEKAVAAFGALTISTFLSVFDNFFHA